MKDKTKEPAATDKAEKRKVLRVTKADKSVHIVPVENKDFYERLNKQVGPEKRSKLEELEMTDAEIAKQKPFDENYVPVLNNEVKTLQAAVADKDQALAYKDAEIEELRRQLAEKK